MANIRKLTKAERILLEIEDKHKFKLSFNDMLKLREYIKLVGNITSFYFNIQSEFFDVTQDIHELENFNKRISNYKNRRIFLCRIFFRFLGFFNEGNA